MKNENSRKTKLINVKIGEDKRKRIPQVFSTIFKMIRVPVCDDDNPDDDETYFSHSLDTIDVEGVIIVNNGKAVRVNGDFDISLEDEEEDEKSLVKKIWADQDEAIEAWRFITKLQLDKAEKQKEKLVHIINHLTENLEKDQY
jgi:hypothetical protein